MDATLSSVKKLRKPSVTKAEVFVAQLKADYPQFAFHQGAREHWSPNSRTITFNSDKDFKNLQFCLLHELSHALLGHSTYGSDLELIKLESRAWELAAKIGKRYKVNITNDHIQNCLDTYRDWLHRRSRCPNCGANGLQKTMRSYCCINCQAEWSVTSDRFVRAYRKRAI